MISKSQQRRIKIQKEAVKEKRYFLNIVEYGVMNPDFEGYRVGRIEVIDSESDSAYAIGEGSFTLPEELGAKFREIFDFIRLDKKCRIHFDMFDMAEREEERKNERNKSGNNEENKIKDEKSS